jgi:DNA gyrase subunit B
MDVHELVETCLDPNNRILRRLTMEDAMEATRAADRFEVLMGSDVARRKAFLLENSELVDPAALDV